MTHQFLYNIPHYNTLTDCSDSFIPVVCQWTPQGINIEFERVPAWVLVNVKNWGFLIKDIEILAKQFFSEKAMAKAFGAESLTA